MDLRSLAISGGALAAAVLSPLVLVFALIDRPDVARGLLLGLVLGCLNSLLLANKLDRVMTGRESWMGLTRTMPRNMLLRFALIFAIGATASRIHGINLAAMAAGLGVCVIVGIVHSCWSVNQRWKKQMRASVYG